MGEQAEDRTAAAAHGGVGGTEVVERLLDGADLGMRREDARLEVVAEAAAPFRHRARDDVGQVRLGPLGRHAGVSLARGDVGGGLDEQERPSFQREREGREPVADAGRKDGAFANEERTVGSEGCKPPLHFRLAQPEGELLVQLLHHVGRVAAASAQPGAGGDVLVHVNVEGGEAELLLHCEVDPHDEVVRRLTVDSQPDLLEGVGRVGVEQGFCLERVAQRDGVENRLQIVVAVGTFLHHVEAEVDFSRRES